MVNISSFLGQWSLQGLHATPREMGHPYGCSGPAAFAGVIIPQCNHLCSCSYHTTLQALQARCPTPHRLALMPPEVSMLLTSHFLQPSPCSLQLRRVPARLPR